MQPSLDELNRLYDDALEQAYHDWPDACARFEQIAAAAEALLKREAEHTAAAEMAAQALQQAADYYGNGEGKRAKARKILQRADKLLQQALQRLPDAAHDVRARVYRLQGQGHFQAGQMWMCFDHERLQEAFAAAAGCFAAAFDARADSQSALLAAESIRLQHQDNCSGLVTDEHTDYSYLQAAEEWYRRALDLNADDGEIWFKRGKMYAWAATCNDLPYAAEAEHSLHQALQLQADPLPAAEALTEWLYRYPAFTQPETAAAAWVQVKTLWDGVRERVPQDAAAWLGSVQAFNQAAYESPFGLDEFRTAQSWCVQAARLQADDEAWRDWTYLIGCACQRLPPQPLRTLLAETERLLPTLLPEQPQTVLAVHQSIAEEWQSYQSGGYAWQHPFALPEQPETDDEDEYEDDGEADDAAASAGEDDGQTAVAAWLNDRTMPKRALFVRWLLALYGGQTAVPAAIVQQWQDEYGDDDGDFTPSALFERFFALHNALPNYSRLFAVDWKDGDSLIAYAQAAAEHFGLTLQWSRKNREQDGPERLLPVLAAQTAGHAAVYSLQTGGDYYYIALVNLSHSTEWEQIATQWRLAYERILPAAAESWLDKIARRLTS